MNVPMIRNIKKAILPAVSCLVVVLDHGNAMKAMDLSCSSSLAPSLLLQGNSSFLCDPKALSCSSSSACLQQMQSGESLYLEAAEFGVLYLLGVALEKGVSLTARDDRDRTPLHRAAHSGKISAVEYLVSKGISVNIQRHFDALWSRGVTPLHEAVAGGHKEVVKFLVEKGAFLNAKTASGKTPLLIAAKKGFDEIAHYLLSKEADVNATTDKGETALHFFARKGNKELVELALLQGANVTLEDHHERTALHYAVNNGSVDIVELLINKGAPVYSLNPLLKKTIYRLGYRKETPLHHAVKFYFCTIAERLLKQGTEIDAQDKQGRTALHWAIIYHSSPCVELLLKRGANPNIQDNEGRTPLHYCFSDQNFRSWEAQQLIEHGADQNIRSFETFTHRGLLPVEEGQLLLPGAGERKSLMDCELAKQVFSQWAGMRGMCDPDNNVGKLNELRLECDIFARHLPMFIGRMDGDFYYGEFRQMLPTVMQLREAMSQRKPEAFDLLDKATYPIQSFVFLSALYDGDTFISNYFLDKNINEIIEEREVLDFLAHALREWNQPAVRRLLKIVGREELVFGDLEHALKTYSAWGDNKAIYDLFKRAKRGGFDVSLLAAKAFELAIDNLNIELMKFLLSIRSQPEQYFAWYFRKLVYKMDKKKVTSFDD